MPNLVLRFPAGRYHATPWGNHVNEGLVEWPPSPWRILRALLATGYTKLGWREPPPAARELAEGLASTLPEYRLPPAIAAHTRHFVPTDSKKPEDRTKIFDAFAHVGASAELVVSWPSVLTPAAEALLAELVPKLSYLGRAESVVMARLAPQGEELPAGDLATTEDVNRPGVEPISLLAPMTSAAYAAWLAAAAPAGTGKAPKKSAKSPFPPDALAAVLVDTSFLQEHGWTQPPGSRRIVYYRPPLATTPARTSRPAPTTRPADTAVLALSSDTSRGDVLPPMARALPQMELLHRSLVSRVGLARCPELTGRDEAGAPARGHAHAHLVPLDLDGDGKLDHVLVHAAMGLGDEAQQALRSVRSTFTKGGGSPLFVTLVGLGMLTDLRVIGGSSVPQLAEARVWRSVTPFVPPRHLKATRHTLEDQVQAELASRSLPAATRIDILDREEVIARGFHHVVRARRKPAPLPPAPRFFGLRIELARPAAGPIALGYASHFGLGLFAATDP